MRIKTKKVTVSHTRIVLSGLDILRLVAKNNLVKITEETKVLFTVPTGGDYSGVTLDLLNDKNLTIVISGKSYDK